VLSTTFSLKKTLDHGGYVPERDPQQLETVLASAAEATYGRDGTGRSRQCPCDPEKQKHSDSADIEQVLNEKKPFILR
jgi:hypothetical protein